MRCFYCNKNEAVKSYKRTVQGKKQVSYYCLSCYEKLFLCVKTGSGALSVCPYCGTTVEEFERSKIVGCSYCYQTLQEYITPAIVKMQGDECGHRGKDPILSEEADMVYGEATFAFESEQDELRRELRRTERFDRQKKELKELVSYLETKDPDRKKEYAEKLERMLKTGKVEEEIVW